MDNTGILLEEYKLCQNKTEKLEDTIWKTSGAIGFGSLGAFVLVNVQTHKPQWQTILILGFLVSATSLIWWLMARRWWDIQHTTFLRMRQLEEKLHFYQVHYIYHKDGKLDLQPNHFTLPQTHIDELNGGGDRNPDKRYHLRGVQSWLRLLPFWIIPLSWFEYTLYKWNEETGFYNTQCPKQFVICVAANVVILLGIFIISFYRIKCGLSDRTKRIQARYSNKKKGGNK